MSANLQSRGIVEDITERAPHDIIICIHGNIYHQDSSHKAFFHVQHEPVLVKGIIKDHC